MKKLLVLLLLSLTVQSLGAQHPYQNASLSPDDRAADLLGRMTLEEKISQMQNASAAVERLEVLPTDWWNEALHGVARAGRATVFPQAIALAATFDHEAVFTTFDMISDEARAKHHAFKSVGSFKRYQGLTFWTPNINIYRDPRWGRGMETYGEDPYLTTLMGLAAVRGLQGDGSTRYDKTHACAKHYAVHSGPEHNRHSFDAKNISSRDLWETYLPAFRSLVMDGGVKEVMCAYNRFEGFPCCASEELLIRILREEWGFDDVIVSDCGGIDDFFKEGAHGTHDSAVDASADAVLHGTDLVCGRTYDGLHEAVKQGLISEEQLDVSVFRLLKARFELGMFDSDEEVSWAAIPYSVVECEEHVNHALDMARKSMVLLENKNNVLPLSRDRKIAVIGPNAADSVMLWANYNGTPTKSVTILEGIGSKIPAANLLFDPGCDYVDNRVFTSRMDLCSHGGRTGFRGTFWNTHDFSGEVALVEQITGSFSFDSEGHTVFYPGVNLTDFSARFESTFVPDFSGEVIFRIAAADGYRMTLDGREFAAEWDSRRKAPKEYTYMVEEGKPVEIVLEYFQKERYAYLRFDIVTAEEIDYRAVAERAAEANVIVFVGGITPRLEGESMSVELPGFHGGDRTRIELPEVQQKLLRALHETGKPVVLVLCSGSSMALAWEAENLEAILAAWYPGQQGGNAVADVLFGDYNPAGRLPLTFYASTEELPDFGNYDMKDRTYRYYTGKAVYPFGHGLSYSDFEYGEAVIRKDGENTCLHVEVTNTGTLDGDEVVQLYIRDLQDPNGPLKSLRGFNRVHIRAGETVPVSIGLPDDVFEFYDPVTERTRVKTGRFELLYGGTSDRSRLKSIPFEW